MGNKDNISEEQRRKAYEQGFKVAFELVQLLYPDKQQIIKKIIETKKNLLTYEDVSYLLDNLNEANQYLAKAQTQLDDKFVLLENIMARISQEKNAGSLILHLHEVLSENPQWLEYNVSSLSKPRFDNNGNQIDSMLDFLLKQLKQKQDLPKVIAKKTNTLSYPIDKVNFKVWNLFATGNLDNIPIAVENGKSKAELNIYYAINFDELEDDISIAKKLLPYDKRAYVAIAALFDAGNKVVTLTQIYHAMGFTGTPGRSDRDKINDSITKMRSAQIKVDNAQECSHYKYPRFVYDGSLLPSERVTAVVNGQLSEAAIHLFREPPLITFAKERKQITTLDIKLLQSPISKTDINLQIEGYLIERIARAKNGTGNSRILYQTILDQIGIDEMSPTKQKNLKKRLPTKIKKYLDYYVKCKNIKSYKEDDSGVNVCF